MNRDNLGNTWPDGPAGGTASYTDIEKEKARGEVASLLRAVPRMPDKPFPYSRAGYDEPQCNASPQGQAVAGKQHLLGELEERRKYYADQITRNYAEAHRLAETIQRLTTAINLLTLHPNFAEFCELLGLKVPDVR